MAQAPRPPAVLVTTFAGDPPVAQLEREAAQDARPRKDYVVLARRIGAIVIDSDYMERHASRAARAVAGRAGMPAAQVLETFLRRRRFGDLVAWSDRLGIGLATLLRLSGSRRDMVLISVLLSSPKKAGIIKRLRLHGHFRAILSMGTVQMRFAAEELGVAQDRLHHGPHPVDLSFWRAAAPAAGRTVCAVGWEARDYPTLFAAVEGLDVQVEVAVGSVTSPGGRGAPSKRFPDGVPANVRVRENLGPPELRELYERSRFVVVPLHDVDFDAGVTVITESMGMARPVVVTRTRGQVDVVRDGETGVYVPPDDPAALRAAIARLLDDPDECLRLGDNGRALAEERHSLDAFIEQIAGLVARG